nr:hypothetical protein [Sphingomonas sp. Ant H11]
MVGIVVTQRGVPNVQLGGVLMVTTDSYWSLIVSIAESMNSERS